MRERPSARGRSGIPYSRSLAGVRGRLEVASELRDGWGDMVRAVGRTEMLISLGLIVRGDMLYASVVVGEEGEVVGREIWT